jgi:hypothetical protein
MGELKTPELDKLAVVNKRSQIIGEFLEWLKDQNIELCYFHQCGTHCDKRRCSNVDQYCPGVPLSKEERVAEKLAGHPLKTARGTQEILASYFGVNLDAVEDERRALLDHLRTLNDRRK